MRRAARRGDDLRNVRNDRDAAVVFCGIQFDRYRSQVKGERFENRVGCSAIGYAFVVGDHPRPADEQVGSSGDRSPALATRHRMRADVTRNVCSESAKFVQRRKLHACDIRDERIGVGSELGGDRLRDDIGWHANDDQPRCVTGSGGTSSSVVDRELDGGG